MNIGSVGPLIQNVLLFYTVSVLPEPTATTKDDNSFINHTLDTNTSTNYQDLEIQGLAHPQCNGFPSTTFHDTSNVTKDSRDCVTVKSANTCNGSCMTNENPSTSQMDCVTIIERKAQHSLPTCKMDWMKNPCLYKVWKQIIRV